MKFISIALAFAVAVPIIAAPVPETVEEDEFYDDEYVPDDVCDSPEPQEALQLPSTSVINQYSSHHHTHTTKTTITTLFQTAPALATGILVTGSGGAPLAIPTNSEIYPNGTDSTITASILPTITILPTGVTLPTTTATPEPTAAGVLRGVNIGHWLVIEPWMDDGKLLSGKFKGAPDQWTFDSLDTDGTAIKAHWDSWFTEADVQRLKGYGFNALRIPIGYWAFKNDGTPYRTGAAEYVDKAIGWAKTAGMKVMIDCHGSPGSQNGQMHSGHQGAVNWQSADNLNISTEVLQQMTQRWATIENADTVFAIELVNEPSASAPNSFAKSQKWASDAYTAIQQTIADNGLNKNIQIITHDSFMGIKKFISIATRLISPANRPTFGVDQHDYQLFTTADNSLDQPAHIRKACGWAADLALTKASMPVYVGEWSALTNICVDENGNTTPSKTNKAGSCATSNSATWSSQLREQVRRYVEAQLDVYEANSDGHFIWSFRAPGGWGLYNLIDIGVFPQPMDDRKYPGQCT